ncbi:transcriptional regulator [Actinomadura sp. NBRC 104412]|nr:transcriptional regulator [Actinomadura sp. NBRC 104412]
MATWPEVRYKWAVAETSRRRPDPVSLPGITPLTTTRLADDLAERIRSLILSEDIAEGARLPPERELAERFGASRPTVSQALRALSLMGLVEIRRGSGAYVIRRPETMVTTSVNLMLDFDRDSVGRLLQLRLWLETLGVQEAAARTPELDEEEAAAVRRSLDRLGDGTRSVSEWIAADTVFHATVVRAAGNPYLAAMYESIHTAVLSYEYKDWVDTEAVPDWLARSDPRQHLALHEPIATAVLARDPEAAKRAVDRHHEAMLRHIASLRP